MNDDDRRFFLQLPDNDPILDIQEAVVKAQQKFGFEDNGEFARAVACQLPNYFRLVYVCEPQLGGI